MATFLEDSIILSSDMFTGLYINIFLMYSKKNGDEFLLWTVIRNINFIVAKPQYRALLKVVQELRTVN